MIFTQDLILHMSVGMVLALPTIKWKWFPVVGIIAGIGKEIYDEIDYGWFDPLDMLYTFFGVAIIAIPCYLVRFIISYNKATKMEKS
jgi:hypothetical protein